MPQRQKAKGLEEGGASAPRSNPHRHSVYKPCWRGALVHRFRLLHGKTCSNPGDTKRLWPTGRTAFHIASNSDTTECTNESRSHKLGTTAVVRHPFAHPTTTHCRTRPSATIA